MNTTHPFLVMAACALTKTHPFDWSDTAEGIAHRNGTSTASGSLPGLVTVEHDGETISRSIPAPDGVSPMDSLLGPAKVRLSYRITDYDEDVTDKATLVDEDEAKTAKRHLTAILGGADEDRVQEPVFYHLDISTARGGAFAYEWLTADEMITQVTEVLRIDEANALDAIREALASEHGIATIAANTVEVSATFTPVMPFPLPRPRLADVIANPDTVGESSYAALHEVVLSLADSMAYNDEDIERDANGDLLLTPDLARAICTEMCVFGGNAAMISTQVRQAMANAPEATVA